MNLFLFCVLLCCVNGVWPNFSDMNARFRCGIRKKFGVNHKGRPAWLGQWPWHAALFHGEDYKCGGTLIDQLHVLTSSECVDEMVMDTITIQLGKNNLDEYPEHVQIMRPVQYSEFVIPICIDGDPYKNLVGQWGWMAQFDGFGETKLEKSSKHLRTNSMLVVNNQECTSRDPKMFFGFNSLTQFCGNDEDGVSVCRGDIGGGTYIFAGDHWELLGVIGRFENGSCNKEKYVVFTNVMYYNKWIKRHTGEGAVAITKRIKCREYSKFAAKHPNGVCYNSRSPHTVAIIDLNQQFISSGSIISERFVLTKAPSLFDIFVSNIIWDDLFVRLFNQPDKRVIREIVHPDYEPETLRHHIMLLELDSPLVFSSQLLPACLANAGSENLYDTLLLNGYSGQTAYTYDFYETVGNLVITNENCNETVKKIQKKYTINKEELCTTDWYEESFLWRGMVGGPLQTVNNRSCMFTQVGVTKFIIPNIATEKNWLTNVYYRVAVYLDWIEEEVWGNETLKVNTEFEDEV